MTSLPLQPTSDLRGEVVALFARRRRFSFLIPALILAYLIYIAVAFDFAGIAGRARMDNAATLLSDFWSYKTHVTRDARSGSVSVAIEGEAKGLYPRDKWPAWVKETDGITHIDLGRGSLVTYEGDRATFTIPGSGDVVIERTPQGVTFTAPPGFPKERISASDAKVTVTGPQGRVSVSRAKTETFRYAPGWELFFFTIDSPFYGKGPLEVAALAVSGERIDPGQANIALMASEFWNNRMWHHRDVAGALFETILMAFLGTATGAIIALPLAFLAASNLTPSRSVRFGVRRVFDFVRGVDALIWTIVLARAFGPGPLTGALAILITEVGSFGKQFSEALENIDGKQVEGIRSTGANAAQRMRFGVIPQLIPVLLSQVLYSFESNTRSATVIGAIVGGGIGLLLTQAIITQKDWEDVAYYILLIILMVMAMDSLSGWLRKRLIKGGH
ncbi:phosphonate ABC transporter, permease protein PhnE [Tabrizicola sp. J26]|uniref:phosphonate ABC transporter, permease protein PhnE n=1 Tax=Alitabrizicola rongguiensis TaxID=2909234 RepID=UPI001F2A091E|nr:phosphonate ABC transporter, permease protein PhnE [Tabrizicola rongguiensis]MCF1710810.1 phosphonate ABC transporter, permease protein PhnE [Tabrizicola rongguiensis]